MMRVHEPRLAAHVCAGRRLAIGLSLAAWVVAAALHSGCAQGPPAAARSRWGTAPVFTKAHPTTAEAVRHFFGVRPVREQPIDFPHRTHVEQGLTCTEICHEGVTQGPIAGLPSLKTCMVCHSDVATDRPAIQRLAELEARGLDVDWPRVHGYTEEAHVRFNHAPHVRAGVECATCHGDVASMTVARRVVDLSMSFCVNCHTSRQASTDCLTCHN